MPPASSRGRERQALSCAEAQTELAEIKALKSAFDAAYDEAVKTGDLASVKALRSDIESRMASLREGLFSLERELHLKEQYASQRTILESAGILETLPSGEEGVRGMDGKPYPLPAYHEVMARLRERKDVIKEKKEQGFGKLLLVPFGMQLDDLSRKYADLLRKHHAAGKLMATKEKPTDPDEPLSLDTTTPLWRWSEYDGADVQGKLVYEPTAFDRATHGGKTKAEMLAEDPRTSAPSPRSSASAWRILLLEESPNIPRATKGKDIGGRTQLEANQTPNDYLAEIGTGTYANESGLTPEDWLAYAITHLEETNEVIDDWQGRGSIAYLTGAYFPASGYVPRADWNRGSGQAYLSGDVPANRYGGVGARSAVSV